MTRRIRSLISGFRLPSINAMILTVEETYLNTAENPQERAQRQREIAAGRFRDW